MTDEEFRKIVEMLKALSVVPDENGDVVMWIHPEDQARIEAEELERRSKL